MQSLDEFPFFEPTYDEIVNSLAGMPEVQNELLDENECDDLFQYMVLQPNFWESNQEQEDFDFEPELIVGDDMIEINGEYTEDLDLFFNEEDVEGLFNFVNQDYAIVCDLGLKIIKAGDNQIEVQPLNDELLTKSFNYLSEDKEARDVLYLVCLNNENLSDEDQKVMHDSREQWERLFS